MAPVSKLSPLLLLLCFSSFCEFCHSQNLTGNSCRLTTGIRGICKPYNDCPYVKENLRSTINRLYCGSSPVTPLICCPFPLSLPSSAAPTLAQKVIAKRPGEAAKYWCEKYLETCSGRYDFQLIPISRVGRSIKSSPEFGTSEAPDVETTTQGNIIRQIVDDDILYIPETRIMDEFPHLAAIGFGNESNVKWACGGALVSDKFVLTSSHCLLDSDGGPAQWVQLGSDNLPQDVRDAAIKSGRGQTHYVIRRIRHPLYRISSRYNDLALIEFGPSLGASPRVVMSSGLHPACLQTENKVNASEVVASGWGRNTFNPNSSLELKKVKMSILNDSICNGEDMHHSLICVGERHWPRYPCRDEIGGPLQVKLESGYCKYRLIGIKSSGKICESDDSTVVYTRVSDFIPWIESVLWPGI